MSDQPPENDIAKWLNSAKRVVRPAGDAKSKSALVHRRLNAPLDRVWTAFTNRDQLRRWFGNVSGDLREGAMLTIDVGAACNVASQILRCEPPHRLVATWWYQALPPDHVDEVELRLAADGDGTLVDLEHRSHDKSKWWLGAGSGWEFALIKMSVLLQGGDPATVSAKELDQKLGPLWEAVSAGD